MVYAKIIIRFYEAAKFGKCADLPEKRAVLAEKCAIIAQPVVYVMIKIYRAPFFFLPSVHS